MLNRNIIASFDPCGCSLDDLKLFVIQVDAIVEHYTDIVGLEPEAYLAEKLKASKVELNVRMRAERERQLARLRAEQETLLSAAERKKKNQDAIVRLERELAEK